MLWRAETIMIEYQKTLKEAISFEGVGLHTGVKVKMILEPAAVNTGIRFKRRDLEGEPEMKADVAYVYSTERSTSLKHKEAVVHTVEHVLSAITGFDLDNVMISLDNEEVPIMDGSAQAFVSGIKKAGVVVQDAERIYFPLNEVIRFYDEEKQAEMVAIPSERFQVSTAIDFDTSILSTQHADMTNISEFEKEIAPARTFCFLHEVQALVDNNLIKGGSLDNAIVFSDRALRAEEKAHLSKIFTTAGDIEVEEGILNNVELRYSNEPARHKLLDVVGDLTLIGMKVRAKFFATRPGHSTNVAFAKLMRDHIKKQKHLQNIPQVDIRAESVVDIRQIETILPHRYPFLLVDKILKMDENEIIGLKMVTYNEPFFQGHFPNNPVMPGVLQLEAMAQTGGIMVLNTVPDPENYVTYFLKIDKAKFRNVVRPGDALVFQIKIAGPVRRGICEMHGVAYVGNKIAAEAEMTAQIVRKKD